LSRITWKQNSKKFGRLKSKRQYKKLSQGKPMNRNVINPKTRSESI
jgi:hypothetical protein